MDLNVVCLQQEPIMKKKPIRKSGLQFAYSADHYKCGLSNKRCPYKKVDEKGKIIEIEFCDFGMNRYKG